MEIKYLNEIKKQEGTDSEIQVRLGFKDPNKVRPRRFELVNDFNKVEGVYKRRCKVTGVTATVWCVISTPHTPLFPVEN